MMHAIKGILEVFPYSGKQSMRRILLLCGVIAFSCIWGGLQPSAWGQDRPLIHDVLITPTDQEVLLYSTLKGGFSQELLEAIESGIPATITFYMKLFRKRGMWFDEEVLSKTIKHVVKYNALKKEYRFSEINGLFSSIKVTKQRPIMVQWMSDIDGQPLIPFHLLHPGEEYYVKVMADLKAIKSLFPLSYIPFVASLWDTGTSWAISSPFTIRTPPSQQ
jgi:hypothetical protein